MAFSVIFTKKFKIGSDIIIRVISFLNILSIWAIIVSFMAVMFIVYGVKEILLIMILFTIVMGVIACIQDKVIKNIETKSR